MTNEQDISIESTQRIDMGWHLNLRSNIRAGACEPTGGGKIRTKGESELANGNLADPNELPNGKVTIDNGKVTIDNEESTLKGKTNQVLQVADPGRKKKKK